VQPPGKRFREMQLLSGGEKTQAALALVFALHAFRPSPFLVMDEVDAALDSSNVHKVASYIRRRAVLPVSAAAAASSGAGVGAGGRKEHGGSGAGGGSDVDALSAGLQAIVISLKPGFFDKASALVGIYQDAGRESSGSLTLDLDKYGAGGGGGSSDSSVGSGSAPRSAASGGGTSYSAGSSRAGSVYNAGSGAGAGVAVSAGRGAGPARRK
jgi:structural maintenance of chromosome 1